MASILRSSKDYRVLRQLGEGKSGSIVEDNRKKCDLTRSGSFGIISQCSVVGEPHQLVALKSSKGNWGNGVPSHTIREISILKRLRGPRVVQLLEVVSEPDGALTLVLEYMETDLRKLLNHSLEHQAQGKSFYNFGLTTSGPDKLSVKDLCFQLLKGVEHCHSMNILHRDIKPENVLINASGVLKLADFGLARPFSGCRREYTLEVCLCLGTITERDHVSDLNKVVTLCYRALELLLGDQEYSTAIDMWSVGCIFSELCTGEKLFQADSVLGQIHQIFRYLVLSCLVLCQ